MISLYSPIGLLKMYATRCAQDTARDAVQIFGGRGITKTGMGRFIEHVCLHHFHTRPSRGLYSHVTFYSTTGRSRSTRSSVEVSCNQMLPRVSDLV